MQKPEIETEKFRIESTRLKDWDYSKPWWYFVTINTADHKHWFGNIENGEMILNKYGKIVNQEWFRISELREYVELDYYVIMPNHIHGIIIINEREGRDVARYVSTSEKQYSKISPKPGSLSAIVRSFKSAVTKHIHETGGDNFKWQSRFYDRIVRNEKEFYKIRKYIEENPLKWESERDNDNSKSYKG